MKANATILNGILTMSTGRIERVFDYNNGNPRSVSMTDLSSGKIWDLKNDKPDANFPGIAEDAVNGEYKIYEVEETTVCEKHLAVQITCDTGTLQICRIYRLFDGSPAIKSEIYLRGIAIKPWVSGIIRDADKKNIENPWQIVGINITAPHIESFKFDLLHLKCKAVSFRDITDLRNNLVREESFIPYNSTNRYDGNILLATETLTGSSLFILKESPCSDVQLAHCGADFMVSRSEITTVGIGLNNTDIVENEWRRGYSVVTGVGDSEDDLLVSLRQYQLANRRFDALRDDMVLVNTWGDRGQYSRICEEFIIKEIENCAKLGVSHLQLDDGWQNGQSSNSASAGGSLENIWNERDDYWMPHPDRFPQGLQPAIQFARENGIDLGLWFNPSKDDSYANWHKDAQILIDLHKKYGSRVFKRDGVVMPDAVADINLRNIFNRVVAESNGEVRFNLDVTSGRRWGYHTGTEYGNLFIENRYTDWGNYYPHWTLRNLWQLAKYVPSQLLQMEFLNILRNNDKYNANDPLRPAEIPVTYAFAVTMMAQPLGWFEAQQMGNLITELAPEIKIYRKYQHDIHNGMILPIGNEPDGTQWTGFQSINAGYGYLAVYREYNEKPDFKFKLHAVNGRKIVLKYIMGDGADFIAYENVVITLPHKFSYALYKYNVIT